MNSAKPAPAPARALQASFHGSGGTLFGIMIVNLLLTLVTLGIYSFWGKARVRRYLYSQTQFAGDRFAYHGTGKELFLGALKAFVVLAGGYAVFFLVAMFVSPGLAVALLYIGILVLIPIALHGSMRYAMSRTSWRGIRFSFRGKLGDCIKEYLGGVLLTAITFGVYLPFFTTNMRRYWTRHTYFGNTAFGYDGEGKDLVWHYLLAIVLTLPTLGLYWIWYSARTSRYHWSRTTFGGGRFESRVTGGGLLWLSLTNLLPVILTLGLAFPWVMVRNIRFLCERTALMGDVAWNAVLADARAPKVGATGEGLADGLDIGVAIG